MTMNRAQAPSYQLALQETKLCRDEQQPLARAAGQTQAHMAMHFAYQVRFIFSLPPEVLLSRESWRSGWKATLISALFVFFFSLSLSLHAFMAQ